MLKKVVGYHGTTAEIAEKILDEGFKGSERLSSWLGPGVYFFLNAPHHAAHWARCKAARVGAKDPVVLKANLHLERALNLLDREHWAELSSVAKMVPDNIKDQVRLAELFKPTVERDSKTGFNYRDCYILNTYVEYLVERGRSVDAVIAAFVEGQLLHPTSFFLDESHVSICIKEPTAISHVRISKKI